MTDADSETVEDVKNTPISDVIDDSCPLQFIEIVPFDGLSESESGDCCKPEFIDELVKVKHQHLQDVKQEPADDYNTAHPFIIIQVRSECKYVSSIVIMCYVFVYNS